MPLFNSIFKKPRQYDNNWQLETIPLEVNDTIFYYTFDHLANRQILSVGVEGRTTAGIHPTSFGITLAFYDGTNRCYEGLLSLLKSSQTYKHIFQVASFNTITGTPHGGAYSQLPDYLYVTPGMVMEVDLQGKIAGDDIDDVFIVCKRWKL